MAPKKTGKTGRAAHSKPQATAAPRAKKIPVAFRIEPAIKDVAMRRARAKRWSFAGYIQWLVIKDAEEGDR